MNLILGCDPGFSGAIAFYNFETKILDSVFDMPVFKNSKNGKTEIDIAKLASLIDEKAKQIRLAVIEEVGVMTGKEGRQGMFRFGVGVGIIRGILASYMIPVFPVLPAVWKSIEGLSSDKKLSLAKANKLFPDTDFFKLQKHDGRAEAAILSRFGERLLAAKTSVR